MFVPFSPPSTIWPAHLATMPLLQTSRDPGVAAQVLYRHVAIQTPVSQDTISCLSSRHTSLLVSSRKKSTLLDPPQHSTQRSAQDSTPVAGISANPRTGESNKPSARPRRQPVLSEQPSVSALSELGIKVRDFCYENILPPLPSVRLPPPRTQLPSSGHANVPHEIHNVLEEKCKKEAHLPESTRTIRQAPTEPILDSGCVSSERQKIRRTNALLDLSSRSDLQPPSSYDATGTIQSAPQPIQLGTSIPTSNGSIQWLESSALTATSSAGPSILSSQINYVTAPSELGFPNSQAPSLNAMAVSPISQFCDPNYSAIQGSLKQVSESYGTLTTPLPPVLYSVPPARSTLQQFSSGPFSHLPPSTSALSNESMFPCYNRRINKRRAESPPYISPGEYYPPRKRIKTSFTCPGIAVKKTAHWVPMKNSMAGWTLRRFNGRVTRGRK